MTPAIKIIIFLPKNDKTAHILPNKPKTNDICMIEQFLLKFEIVVPSLENKIS